MKEKRKNKNKQTKIVLQNLTKNKDIIITKSNKGSGVVIIDRKLFDKATQKIISDTSKFEELDEYPIVKLEGSIQRLLHKLKQKQLF